jgi:hypothetical protein
VTKDVDPGKVVVIIWPGRVRVETTKFVTVLAGNWTVRVLVAPGWIMVDNIVDAGNWDTTVVIAPGCVMVTNRVLAGN